MCFVRAHKHTVEAQHTIAHLLISDGAGILTEALARRQKIQAQSCMQQSSCLSRVGGKDGTSRRDLVGTTEKARLQLPKRQALRRARSQGQ